MQFVMPPIILLGVSILLNIIMIALFSWTYEVFTQETPIATISFESNKNEKFHIAHLTDSDNDVIGDYRIHGDQWRIDAKFMKMKYWANLLGLDSRYSLERIEGRYKNISDQNMKKHLAYDLGDDTVIDSITVFGWSPFIDTEYGSSTYKSVNPEYTYSVYKTQTGLMIRDKKSKTNENNTDDSSIVNKLMEKIDPMISTLKEVIEK